MKTFVEDYKGKKVHNLRFYNLTDLYDYLKSDPPINRDVFRKLSSMSNHHLDFYGEPLPKAIEYIIYGYNQGLDNFLEISSNLSKVGYKPELTYREELSLYGGVPIASLVAQGINQCMLSNVYNEEYRVIDVYYNLSYPAKATDGQIRNRGLATIYIIQALEAKGYLVNFRAFELSKCNNEMFHLNIDLKKPGELFLNVEKCYYPMVAKEFLRRILFRIIESSSVKNRDWDDGYGYSCSVDEMRDYFKTKEQDIVISAPSEMGITGLDIYEDTLNLIRKLNLENEFDVKKIKSLSRNQ